MREVLFRLLSAVIALCGIALFIGSVYVTLDGGMSLVLSSGYVLVLFVGALSILMACGGFSLAYFGNTGRSLVPRWALITGGGLLFLAVVTHSWLATREGRQPNPAGVLILGSLAIYWFRSGIRGTSANHPLKRDAP